jgi:hypothetical protein
MLGLSRKVQASLTAALLFFVISSPFTYTLVDNLINSVVGSIAPQYAMTVKVADAGSPTNFGLLLHGSLYGLITYQLMG